MAKCVKISVVSEAGSAETETETWLSEPEAEDAISGLEARVKNQLYPTLKTSVVSEAGSTET